MVSVIPLGFRFRVMVSVYGFGFRFRVSLSVNPFINLPGVSGGVVFFISLFPKNLFSLFSNLDIHFPAKPQDVLE